METLAEQSLAICPDQIAVRGTRPGERHTASCRSPSCATPTARNDAALAWARAGHGRIPRLARSSRVRDFLSRSTAAAPDRRARSSTPGQRSVATGPRDLPRARDRRAGTRRMDRATAPPRSRCCKNPQDTQTRRPMPPTGRGVIDDTELVRVLLWEDDPEAAWQAATEGGTTDTACGWSSPTSAAPSARRTRSPYTAATSSSTIAGKDKRSYAACRPAESTRRSAVCSPSATNQRTSRPTSPRSAPATDPSAT